MSFSAIVAVTETTNEWKFPRISEVFPKCNGGFETVVPQIGVCVNEVSRSNGETWLTCQGEPQAGDLKKKKKNS